MSEPQLPPNVAARLQSRVALLEHQNAALRQEQAEQERVVELAKVNEELRQREREVQRSCRLLAVVAEITKDLLENLQVNIAVETALGKLGEAAGISRVCLMQEKPEAGTGRMQHHVLIEWTAPGVPRQSDDSATKVVHNDEYGRLVDDLHVGRSTWDIVDELPEPARMHQAGIEVKSTGAVPIFIEGAYFGCVGFDDCVDYRQWSTQEIDVLTSGAGAIGAALHRKQLVERLIAERIGAEQARAAELAKINAALESEVIARSQAEQLARGQTEALIKILAGLAAEPNLDSFLGNALRAITEQLGERSAGLWLYDHSHDATILHLNYESGTVHWGAQTNRSTASIHCPLKGWDVEYLAALRQQKVLIHTEQEFASPGYATSRTSYGDRGIKTVLYVSLFFGDRFLGFITIRSTQTRHYQSEEIELARVLAYQVALAIQLTQLAKQAQQSAVLEERNRLARDIHDTLAQVLTGVIVQLQAAENPYTTEPRDRQEHLTQAHLLAKQGLTEARRSIRALRSQILEATDFAGALTDLAEQMAVGIELQVNCEIEAAPYWLEPDVESHLFRIAQEAMTNTLKHAQASTLHLKLVYEPSQVQLQVADDGQGFDPTITSVSGYGVIGMQERSQQIGAQFRLTSHVGQGTVVHVIVPISTPALTRSFP